MDIRLIFRTSQFFVITMGVTQKDKQDLLWLWGSMRVSWFS